MAVNPKEPKMVASLQEVLTYKNENVVYRFSEDYKISESDAEEIFLETKRWLWYCAKRTRDIEDGRIEFLNIPLFNEAKAIDLMWHTFLLFTHDYADFCETYFGFFVHHQPKSKVDRIEWQQQISRDPIQTQKERESQLEKVYGTIYDELGPDILLKWCEEFPKRFDSLN